jgi:hypothetical protein
MPRAEAHEVPSLATQLNVATDKINNVDGLPHLLLRIKSSTKAHGLSSNDMRMFAYIVIPAQAGSQQQARLDSVLRGNDD